MLETLRFACWSAVAFVALACSGTDGPVGAGGASGNASTGGAGPAAGGAGSGSIAGSTPVGGGGTGGGAGTAGGGAGIAGGGTSSGGGNVGGGGMAAVEPTFATVKRVVQMSCFGAPCHDEPGNPLQMKPLDDLVTKLKSHTTQDCGPALTPGSPQDSAFLKLLKADCGGTRRMPLDRCFDDGDPGCVPPEDVAAIEKWIADGAKP